MLRRIAVSASECSQRPSSRRSSNRRLLLWLMVLCRCQWASFARARRALVGVTLGSHRHALPAQRRRRRRLRSTSGNAVVVGRRRRRWEHHAHADCSVGRETSFYYRYRLATKSTGRETSGFLPPPPRFAGAMRLSAGSRKLIDGRRRCPEMGSGWRHRSATWRHWVARRWRWPCCSSRRCHSGIWRPSPSPPPCRCRHFHGGYR